MKLQLADVVIDAVLYGLTGYLWYLIIVGAVTA